MGASVGFTAFFAFEWALMNLKAPESAGLTEFCCSSLETISQFQSHTIHHQIHSVQLMLSLKLREAGGDQTPCCYLIYVHFLSVIGKQTGGDRRGTHAMNKVNIVQYLFF